MKSMHVIVAELRSGVFKNMVGFALNLFNWKTLNIMNACNKLESNASTSYGNEGVILNAMRPTTKLENACKL